MSPILLMALGKMTEDSIAPRNQEALWYPQALTALFMKSSLSDWRQKLFTVCVTHVKRPRCRSLKDLLFISLQNLCLINDADAAIPPRLQAQAHFHLCERRKT